jgi:hypothetical protein
MTGLRSKNSGLSAPPLSLHGGAERDLPVAFLPRERATDWDRVNAFSANPRQKKIDGRFWM